MLSGKIFLLLQCFILVLLASPLLAVNPSVSSLNNQAIFKSVNGEVQVKTKKGHKKTIVAQKKLIVGEGDRIITQKDSSAVLSLFDGSELTVLPKTDFVLSKLEKPTAQDKILQFKLFVGKLVAEVQKLTTSSSSFEIEAGGVVCGVRGTHFSMESDGHHHPQVLLQVFSGSVYTIDGHGNHYIFNQGPPIKFINGLPIQIPNNPNNPNNLTTGLKDLNHQFTSSILINGQHTLGSVQGTVKNRFIHILIASLEFLPIIGQIASLFEKMIVYGTIEKEKRVAEREWKKSPEFAIIKTAKNYMEMNPDWRGKTVGCTGKLHFPPDLPFVFNFTITELEKIKRAQRICTENDYVNVSIPDAVACGGVVVETRLPLNFEIKLIVGIYIENAEKFDNAVSEFIKLFCKMGLFKNPFALSYDPYANISPSIGRYDHVTPYLINVLGETKGFIGIVNLKKMFPVPDRTDYYFVCLEAIRLFPLHFDIIMDVVESVYPGIKNDRARLENERKGVLDFFKTIYMDHLDFVKAKQITFENPYAFSVIDGPRVSEIRDAILDRVIDQQNYFLKNLKDRSRKPGKSFEKVFPKILDAITRFFSQLLEKQVRQNEPHISYAQLLQSRTLVIENKDLKELKAEVFNVLSKVNVKLSDTGLSEEIKEGIASSFIFAIFKELAKGKEIAYYNPDFGWGKDKKQLFYC